MRNSGSGRGGLTRLGTGSKAVSTAEFGGMILPPRVRPRTTRETEGCAEDSAKQPVYSGGARCHNVQLRVEIITAEGVIKRPIYGEPRIA
jgi:hypothetical protein